MAGLPINRLKKYFLQREDIAFAFLFGSYAKGRAGKLSDVDIAVYFYPSTRKPCEFEEPVYYEKEDEIWEDLEKILKRNVELLVLNRAPASIAFSALRGKPIIIKDAGLFLDFLIYVSSQAIDYREEVINELIKKL